MFTGIILAVGKVAGIDTTGGDARLRIHAAGLDLSDTQIGDSIAVNGVCLTAVELTVNGFAADVSGETLSCTNLGTLTPGARVNLELALTPTTRLGGHLVSGHVDGIGCLVERRPDGRSQRLHFEAPAGLAKYIAGKGSICINGVSLTVNEVKGSRFDVNVVPHTLDHTTLGDLAPDDSVNIEVDLLARYLERLLLQTQATGEDRGMTREFLARHGFLK
jgi:riboflavin synthase